MKTTFKNVLSASLLSVILAGCVSYSASATFPGQNGAITFSSTRESTLDSEIYFINSDGNYLYILKCNDSSG